jgi:hypothetical protein
LSKEEIQMAKNHIKKYSPFLAIKEMQIKSTQRFHITPLEQPSSKTLLTTGVGEDVGKTEPSYTAGRNENWCNHSGKKICRLL